MPQNAFTLITSKKIRPKTWRLNDVGYPNIFGDLGSHLINMCDFAKFIVINLLFYILISPRQIFP